MISKYKVVARAPTGATWRVGNYSTLEQAERHRQLASKWATEHEGRCIGDCSPDNPYDVGYEHFATPVKYTVEGI